MLGQVEDGTEPGEHTLVGPEAGIVGVERTGVGALVGVAEQHRVVAERAGLERHVREAGVERRAVERGPVVAEVLPGEERGPAGSARGRLGVVLPEEDPLGREAVEVRGTHRRMPEHRQAGSAPLVERDQQDPIRPIAIKDAAIGRVAIRLSHGR